VPSDAPHGTAQDCIAALRGEIERLKQQIPQRSSTTTFDVSSDAFHTARLDSTAIGGETSRQTSMRRRDFAAQPIAALQREDPERNIP